MKTSPDGITLIKAFEGLELKATPDIAGIPTVGYGHTGPDVHVGDHVTIAEADALLRADLEKSEEAVRRLVKVPLNQNEFDALVSFIYNIGENAFKGSTALSRLNKHDRAGCAVAMLWWDKALVEGVLQKVSGLTNRRKAEKTLFLTPLNKEAFDESVDDGIVRRS